MFIAVNAKCKLFPTTIELVAEEGKEQWIEKTIQCETLSVSCQPIACKVMHL